MPQAAVTPLRQSGFRAADETRSASPAARRRCAVPSSVQAPGRRAVLAALGVGLVAGCTAPAVGTHDQAGQRRERPRSPRRSRRPSRRPSPRRRPRRARPRHQPPRRRPRPRRRPSRALRPPALPNLTGTDPVWHLLRRATFGPTPALVAEVKTIGISAWLDQQLAPAAHRRQRLRRLPHPLPDAADDDAADPGRDPAVRVGRHVRARTRDDRPGAVQQAAALRGDGRVLVEPLQHRHPRRRRLGPEDGRRPRGDPQERARQRSATCCSRARKARRC